MRCFIHIHDEAIAVCKKCGKAMCGNCSAYSNHSGICPECKREEFIQERIGLYSALRANKKSVGISAFLAVLFAAIAIALAILLSVYLLAVLAGSLIFGIKIVVTLNKRKPITDRINYLTGEIDKLGIALSRSAAII